MRLKCFLLKIVLLFTLFTACEEQEDDIVGITKTEVNQSEFLKFNQKQELLDILYDSNINNSWKVSSFLIDSQNITSNFSDTKFVFKENLEQPVIEAFEPEAFTTTLPSFSNTSIIFTSKEEGTDNLKLVLNFITELEQSVIDLSKYESFNLANGYNVLKNITENRVEFISTTATNEKVAIVFEKESTTPPTNTDTEFLKFDEQQQLLDILYNNSVIDSWEIGSFTIGDQNVTSDFTGTKFVFKEDFGQLTIDAFEPEAFTAPILSSSNTSTIFTSKDDNTNDLQLSLNFETESIESLIDLSKYGSFNLANENGYNVLKTILDNKVEFISTTATGEKIIILFDKRNSIPDPPAPPTSPTIDSDFLSFNQKQELLDILSDNDFNNSWKVTSFIIDVGDSAADFEDTKFVFREESNQLIVDAFEPNGSSPPNLNPVDSSVIVIFKDDTTDDLKLLFSFNGVVESSPLTPTKFNFFNLPIENGYKVLKDPTQSRVELEATTVDGLNLYVVFEKELN